MTTLLRLDAVSCAYGAQEVVTGASFSVHAGEFVGIVGPSGSGKTTLLRAVLGLVAPSAGRFTRAPGLTIGYVPQVETVNWNFPVTVFETVLMGRRSDHRWPWASSADKRAAAAMLERLGLDGLGTRHIRELSGGQQQRVFIARALLREPQLLILDEPTSGVDVRTRHEMLHVLGDLHADGLSILLTTHDLNGMAAHLPKLVCLNGEVVAVGPPRAVLTPAVLERTYGAPLDVLEHGGMPIVIDRPADVADMIRLPNALRTEGA